MCIILKMLIRSKMNSRQIVVKALTTFRGLYIQLIKNSSQTVVKGGRKGLGIDNSSQINYNALKRIVCLTTIVKDPSRVFLFLLES